MVYRERSLECPACARTLVDNADPEGLACRSCGRIFVESATVQALLEQAMPDRKFRHALVAFPRDYRDPRVPCPACRELMRAAILFEVAVDQCLDDGFWLAPDALPQILENARARFRARRGLPD